MDNNLKDFGKDEHATSAKNSNGYLEDYSKIGMEGFVAKTEEELWNTLDPETGKRYSIPMLNLNSLNYRNDYIDYMKILNVNPKAFKKILNWD